MYLNKLQIKNLRCFETKELEFDHAITLIEGCNGSGKTTIIEALYYLCYLRSFRTNITQELISFNQDNFFIKANLIDQNDQLCQQSTLQVGFSPAKRLVKLNDKAINSFKDLLDNYRVVILTESDLNIIQGGPLERRSFIDHYIYLQDQAWFKQIRTYKNIIEQRNALLKNKNFIAEQYKYWTSLAELESQKIRLVRKKALKELEIAINQHLATWFKNDLKVEFDYLPREFNEKIKSQELFLERTLFGAHLDDYQIKLSNSVSRKFASRGQQKLIAILMKIVQISLLKAHFTGAILFLLDDFITDLDLINIKILFELLIQLRVQIVFTAPNMPLEYKNILLQYGAKTILI